MKSVFLGYYKGVETKYKEQFARSLPIPLGRELEIEIDSSFFENQSNRLVTELGFSKREGKIFSKALRDLIEAKIGEQGKKWSKSVRAAFTNLIIGILCEEIKAISPTIEAPTAQVMDSVYQKFGTTSTPYRCVMKSSVLVTPQTLRVETDGTFTRYL